MSDYFDKAIKSKSYSNLLFDNKTDALSDSSIGSDKDMGSDKDSADSIEVIKGEIVESEDNYPDETIFKTNDVARFLNTSPQIIRNYMQAFEGIISIEKGPSERRIWRKENIKQLRQILEYKDSHKLSVSETVQALTDPNYALAKISADRNAFNNLTQKISSLLDEKLNKAFEDKYDKLSDEFALKNEELVKRIISECFTTFEQKMLALPDNNDKILDAIEDYKKQNEEKLSNATSAYEQKILELNEKLEKEKENERYAQDLLIKQIATLQESLNSFKSQYEEQQTKKKPWWKFGK